MAFTDQIFMILTIPQLKCVEISYKEFHLNWSQNLQT
jgi:hypothetical protein